MHIENVVAVTGGLLLNKPSISRFETVALSPAKAVRGSLFIAKELSDIDIALKNGTYGIITDLAVTPTDEEIAWIRVDDLSVTLLKLLRLWLVINPRTFHLVSPLTMEFIKMTASDHRVTTLCDDPKEASEQILTSSEKERFFCDNKKFLERIGAYISPLEPVDIASKLITKRIFDSSVIIEDIYYARLPITGCLLPELLKSLGFLKAAKVSYTLSNITFPSSFEPVFIDSKIRRVSFGESERVIIFADPSLPERCFLELQKIKWTECKLFIPTQIKFQCDIKIPMIGYRSEQELFQKLSHVRKKRGFIVIVGQKSNKFFDNFCSCETDAHPLTTKGLF